MFKTAFQLAKETFQDWSEDKAPRLAAALAYYTIFSIAPLLILVIAIVGLIMGSNSNIQEQLFTQIRGMVGAGAADAIQGMVNNQLSKPSSNIIASVIGIVTLLLGATGVFGQLQDALNTIWEVKPKKGEGLKGMMRTRAVTFAMILGVSFLLLVSLVVSTLLVSLGTFFSSALPGSDALWQVLNFLISLAVVSVLFAMIFKYLPDAEIHWRDVLLGGLITAILFNIGKFAIGLYLGNGSVTSAYGAAGSLVVLLIWIYYSAQILFIGAEFTQVYARHRGKSIQPSEHAERITEEDRANQGMNAGRKSDRAAGGRPAAIPAPALSTARVEQVMVPVTAQPRLRAKETLEERHEKVRYEPADPAVVIPVVGLGALAGAATVVRVVKKAADAIHQARASRPSRRRRKLF